MPPSEKLLRLSTKFCKGKNQWLYFSVLPSIVPFSFDGPLMTGKDGGLTCRVSEGDPPLTIRWTFSGKELSSSMGISTFKVGKKTSVLSIDSIMPGHSGNYTCSVSNPAGTANYSAELTVHGTYSFSECQE